MRGRDFYRDNVFEREAFRKSRRPDVAFSSAFGQFASFPNVRSPAFGVRSFLKICNRPVQRLNAVCGRFPERTPQRPSLLLEQSRELQQRLADPELELPPSRVPDFDLDCAQLALKIVPSIDGLGDVLEVKRDHDEDLRESERLQNDALTGYNEVSLQTAGSLESWLRMAGHEDKADRVRPSRRRPGLIHGARTASS